MSKSFWLFSSLSQLASGTTLLVRKGRLKLIINDTHPFYFLVKSSSLFIYILSVHMPLSCGNNEQSFLDICIIGY